MACLGFFTFPPLPDFSSPCLNSCITFATLARPLVFDLPLDDADFDDLDLLEVLLLFVANLVYLILWEAVSLIFVSPSRTQLEIRGSARCFHGFNTTFVQPSCLALKIAYAFGASSSAKRWEITNEGSISPFRTISKSGRM